MAKKHPEGYLSAKESRRISRENRKITGQYEKQYKRKNVPDCASVSDIPAPEHFYAYTVFHTDL